MGANSNIEWTNHTFNIAWGCEKISPGCKNCYADELSHRYGHDIWGANKPRRVFGEKHWNEPLKWNREAEKAGVPAKVFCSSMCDIGEDHPTIAQEREKLWPLIKATPHLIWQLLTKRSNRLAEILPADWGAGYQNVWIGTSVEDQKAADARIPNLLALPAAVRFLSIEPLIGPVDFDRSRLGFFDGTDGCGIHWVIVGGESGPGARPMHPDWARSLRDRCQQLSVPFFFKQWGDWAPPAQFPAEHWAAHHDYVLDEYVIRAGKKKTGRELDGRTWSEFPKDAR